MDSIWHMTGNENWFLQSTENPGTEDYAVHQDDPAYLFILPSKSPQTIYIKGARMIP